MLIRQAWTAVPLWLKAMFAIVVVSGAVIAVLVVASDDEHPERTAQPRQPSDTGSGHVPDEPEPEAEPTSPAERAVALPTTTDPDDYAAAVAGVVLGLRPADHPADEYRSILLEAIDQDVTGNDHDRLVAMTGGWVPDDTTWRRQAALRQRVEFEVESVVEPDRQVFAEDAPTGHEVRTVTGVQMIHYLGEDATMSSHQQTRSVSVWVYCPPDAECSLVAVPREVLH